jgi:hypothetical protein
VHFYRNEFCVMPSKKFRIVANMYKAIHAFED